LSFREKQKEIAMNAKVEKRQFGRTGEQVTALGLGGGALNKISFNEGVATVHKALELGIAYFDTSPLYGDGISQAILGEALRGRSENFLLATKLGHFRDPHLFRATDALWAQLGENLRILHREYVDVLQVHECDWHCWWSDKPPSSGLIRPELAYDFADAPIMQVLREAKEIGLCRHIGITGNNADETARVLQNVQVDTYLVAFNYDLIWRGIRAQALPLARQKGVGLISAAPFHNNRFTEVHLEWLDSPPGWMTPEIMDRFKKLYVLQKESGLSLVTLCIRYLLADPHIALILAGAATTTEVEEIFTAAQSGPLPADLHEAVEALGLSPNEHKT
jgi:L-galactose dehydrogenase